MLEFDASYFQEEERCGFVVPEKMKRAWAAELEVLAEIDRVCKKYHLTYFANWGTLLGAVRHKGYVPWDDDIDIAMKRGDYMKFLQVIQVEMPEGWHISSMHTPSKHNQQISCLMNRKELRAGLEITEEFHGCPYVVGVDIYPLDYVPRDAAMAETQWNLYSVIYDTARRYLELEQNGELGAYLSQIEQLCAMKFDYNQPIRKQLWLLSDKIASLFTEEECDELTWFPRMVCKNKMFRLKKEWYSDVIEMPFENITVPVPLGYHEVLTMMYRDYMTQRQVRGGHDYPFYKKQDAFLEKRKQ